MEGIDKRKQPNHELRIDPSGTSARLPEAWLPSALAPALLALITVAAFANAVPNGFVWIDHWQVEGGGLIVHSTRELWSALRQPLGSMPGWEGAAPYARPVVIVVFSLIHAVADLHPSAYHFAIGSMHLVNVLLTYSLLRVLTGAPAAAFFTSAIFAVHPLQTAAVSWISGIADPLFTVFVLLAFRLQLAASRRAEHAQLPRLGALLSFSSALGAKESAVVFPVLLAVAYFLFPQTLHDGAVPDDRGSRTSRLAAAVAPFFLLVAADLLYRVVVLQSGAWGGTFGTIPLSVRLWTAPRLLLSYLTLPARFSGLTICDDYALFTGWDAWSVAAALAGIVLLAGLAVAYRRWPEVAFGCSWMVLALVPALNVVPILHYRADRFFYFPMIGWSLVCVGILQRCVLALGRRPGTTVTRWRRPAAAAALVIVGALAVVTVRRNRLFADDRTLFEATVRISPFCREARTALGDVYLRAGRSDDAIEQYRMALVSRPDRASYVVLPKVLINLGMAQLARGDFSAAEDAFAQAHQLQPGLLHPLFGLGIADLGLGRATAAVGWLEQAYAIDPADPDITFNLALGYDRSGRASDAAAMYQHYLAIAPRGRTRALAERRLLTLNPTAQ
ncbi:MAG: tetratricopeptide repeat protein [Candidatus Binatia bacterium]